jgi:hypothetical protein
MSNNFDKCFKELLFLSEEREEINLAMRGKIVA